jgi:hypothetical protein
MIMIIYNRVPSTNSRIIGAQKYLWVIRQFLIHIANIVLPLLKDSHSDSFGPLQSATTLFSLFVHIKLCQRRLKVKQLN